MSQTYKICLLPGDGIGPEIIAEGVKVLDAIGKKYDTTFEYTEALLGGIAIDETGTALPQETLDVASASDAVLLAAVGGPKWDTTDPNKPRPEQGLLGIRKALGLYANLRPVKIFNALADASTLKPEVIDGVDMVIVRELTGGLYFGERGREYDVEGAGVDGAKGQRAFDTLMYSEYEVERIVRHAFETARKRRSKVHSTPLCSWLMLQRSLTLWLPKTCLAIFCPTKHPCLRVLWVCWQALLLVMARLCMSQATVVHLTLLVRVLQIHWLRFFPLK